MRALSIVIAAALCAGCSVQRISPEGLVMTRPVTVPARDVAVYANGAPLPARYSVVEEIWVKDNGSQSPGEMLRDLRVKAGARRANAILLASTNRRDNGTRVLLKPTLDNPFDYYSATAIWIGDGPPPVKILS